MREALCQAQAWHRSPGAKTPKDWPGGVRSLQQASLAIQDSVKAQSLRVPGCFQQCKVRGAWKREDTGHTSGGSECSSHPHSVHQQVPLTRPLNVHAHSAPAPFFILLTLPIILLLHAPQATATTPWPPLLLPPSQCTFPRTPSSVFIKQKSDHFTSPFKTPQGHPRINPQLLPWLSKPYTSWLLLFLSGH